MQKQLFSRPKVRYLRKKMVFWVYYAKPLNPISNKEMSTSLAIYF